MFKCLNEFNDNRKHHKHFAYTLIHFLMSNEDYEDILMEIIKEDGLVLYLTRIY